MQNPISDDIYGNSGTSTASAGVAAEGGFMIGTPPDSAIAGML
ncbi:hypothetical protein ACFTZB_17790 [Rhodococcus sp. NPDC057014]